MVRKVALSLAIFAIALTQTSCFEELDGVEYNVSEMMVLGDQLNNPFTVENMQLAIAGLKNSDPSMFSQFPEKLNATHYYVRFLPQDETQLEVLLHDTTLLLSDYPLDYEIKSEGTFYHDPALASSDFTYLYSAVPANHQFPSGIKNEILAQLFLPSSTANSSSGRIGNDEYQTLIEQEAFRLAGISEESIPQAAGARQSSKWTPSGSVTVWDNRLNKFIPLEGVKIEARRWFDIKQAVTDANGNYKMDGTFRHDVNYRLVFERSQFDVRSGTFGQAKINGPKKRGDWNVEIKGKTIEFHYAHVFRAAMRYYYHDIGGLARPAFRLKYAVFNKGGDHAARNIGNWSAFGINPNILIYRYGAAHGNEYDADEIFSNACHETAHATHMQTMNAGVIQFLQVSETIRESWAVGVEWFLTQKEYKEKGILNYGDPGFKVEVNYPAFHAFQYWNKRRSKTLTSLFIDIVDTNNQRGQTFGYGQVGVVNDGVSGYSFAQIEKNILKNVYGLGSLDDALKLNKPEQLTNQQIDLLLEYF
jgi:hypothetical protein